MAVGNSRPENIWDRIRERLKEKGIDLDALTGGIWDLSQMKVVCVDPDLKESVRKMGEAVRDQVVMVRIDGETRKALDAWVETGAVKSRSEAAALFIREGLKVRSQELDQLKDALREVEQAKQRLRDRARDIFDTGAATQ
jgi:Arc/MetJ-type ribon-helix-helix transcriptional regulator